MISIKSMALLLLILLSFFAYPSNADDPLVYYNCGNTQEYFTSNSTYSFNLNLLFSTLYSKGSARGFATYTTGRDPDRAYGLAFCRGDIDVSNCRSCISIAISNIQKLCPNNKGNCVIWYDFCQLIYSNKDFLDHPNIVNSYIYQFVNYDNISVDQPLRYEILLNSLMENVSDLAVRNTSRFFATGEATLTATDIIYGQVQCALSLSIGDCQLCLQYLVKSIVLDNLNRWKGRRVLGQWCNMRYDSYKFYNGKSMLQLASAQLPSSMSPTNAEPMLYYMCGNSTPYFTSTYSSNLNLLFSTLRSNGSATGFASFTSGIIPDSAYGFTICRGDIDVANCTFCISSAISNIQKLCQDNNEGVIWYDYCQLYYSNQDILDHPSIPYNNQYVYTSINNNLADQRLSNETLLTSLMEKVSDLAVRNTSRFFATGEAALAATDIIYGQVQCALDLSVVDCRSCLQSLVDTIAIDKWNWWRGKRALGLWCNMRYESYKFYNGKSILELASDLLPSSLSPKNVSTPNATHPPADLSHRGKKSMSWRRVAIFLPLGILLLLSTFICLIWLIKRKDKGTSNSQKVQMPIIQGTDLASKLKLKDSNPEFSLISFSSIMEATCNFSAANKLGQGGFGSVYKGQLQGESIAVKRLDACSGQGLEEFMNEIKLIAKLQHRNLVKLLGCCVEGEEKLLVYEYMPNNSLEYHLFDPIRKKQLHWLQRIAIIDGIAQGLLYLHKYSRVRIIHRDLKASNILLDPEMNPKISDFGMARIFDATTTQANTNRIVGTYGYMSPEYAMEGLFSIKSDVFSFGVLMLEIISGKRNTTFHKFGKSLNLLSHAWELWKNDNWLEFVDQSLEDKIIINEVSKCIIVALMCVQENAIDRPIMSEIISMLGSEDKALPDPKKPAFFTTEYEGSLEFLTSNLASQNEITFTVLDGR